MHLHGILALVAKLIEEASVPLVVCWSVLCQLKLLTAGLLCVLNNWKYKNSPLHAFIFCLFLTQTVFTMRFVMWSYTGCYLQKRASDENRNKWSVKGGQELLQPASLLKPAKKLHLHNVALIPDKLLQYSNYTKCADIYSSMSRSAVVENYSKVRERPSVAFAG